MSGLASSPRVFRRPRLPWAAVSFSLMAMIPIMPVAAQLGKDWTLATIHAPWTPRVGPAAVVRDGVIWISGGMADDLGWNVLSDVWNSVDGISWTSVTLSAPWGPRAGHSSVVQNGKIWVIGGRGGGGFRNDVWYSSDGVTWTTATASAPWSPRTGHTSVSFGGRIWVMGGLGENGRTNDVWYSSEGANWTSATASAAWLPRAGHASIVFDRKMWVLGGGLQTGGANDVWYSVDGVKWTSATLSAPWPPRAGRGFTVLDGRMWVIGGNLFFSDVWYSSDGARWTSATLLAAWPERDGNSSIATDDRLWIIGGRFGRSGYLNDVWYSSSPTPFAPAMIAEPAWTAGTANAVFWMPAAKATTYTVQCDEAADFATPRATAVVSSPTLSHTFTALADGQTFWYRVRAENGAGFSAWSSATSSTQDATPPTPPGPPSDAGAFTSSTSVRFNWTAATDAGSGVASYDLQVGTAPGQSNVYQGNVGAVLTRTVTAPPGQTVYARVRARDRVANIGAWSPSSDGIVVDATRPRLDAAAARDYRAVEVTFSEAVAGADVAANYTFTGGLRATQASRLSDVQYRLYTTDQSKGTSYTVTVGNAVRDRAGNPMDPSHRSRSFTGLGKTAARRWGLYR